MQIYATQYNHATYMVEQMRIHVMVTPLSQHIFAVLSHKFSQNTYIFVVISVICKT